MELALIMLLGFFVLAARSHNNGADIKFVELLLAGIFLLFAFSQAAG
jgi:hypothetical protein